MLLRNEYKSHERARENLENAAMINHFKQDVVEGEDTVRQRKEAERRFYLDGLEKARKAKLALDSIELGFEGKDVRLDVSPKKRLEEMEM
jgi:hypothetical protein